MLLIRKLVLLCGALALIAGCAAGKSAFNRGEQLEQEGKLDEAIIEYTEASSKNPEVGEYRLRLMQTSAKAADQHLKRGEEFLADKLYDDALREFQIAATLDPSLTRARQQGELALKLRTSLQFLQEASDFEKDRKSKDALRSYQKSLELDPANKEAKEGVERLQKSRRQKLDGFELNLKSTKPITLKFKDAKIKEVFNILGQLSGINFVFDEAIKDTNFSIFLENSTFFQALDIITGLNKLGKKVLNESTIIVYPKTPDKIKQYEELYVETFYLNKLDAKKAVNLIRTMLQVRKIYVNEEMNALVIRDTPDVLEVARKVIEANDIPDPEVVLEVEVVEITKKNVETFGLVLSRYGISYNTLTPEGQFFSDSLNTANQGITNPNNGNTLNTGTNVNTANLLKIFSSGGYAGYITVPSAAFNFGKGVSKADTLANPKMRIKNREKAKFNVGQRVPITTTSSNGTVGGINVNVQYVDVGVKVNAEPTIQLNNEVSIKVSLEVSNILSKETVGDGNTTVVTIGTRNLDTVLNLKDGETSIIGGLLRRDIIDAQQKVALLGDIPVLGRLFTGDEGTKERSELMLAITPRIVRSLTLPDPAVATFWSGLEDDPSVAKTYASFTQEPEPAGAAAPGAAAPGAAPAAAKPAAAPPPPPAPVAGPSRPIIPQPEAAPAAPAADQEGASLPVPLPGAAASPAPTAPTPAAAPTVPTPAAAPAVPAAAAAPVTAAPPPPTSRVSLRFTAPTSAKVGSTFTVQVVATDTANLVNAPFTLVYDPLFLEFVGAAEGDLLKKDGKPASLKTGVDKENGQVVVTLGRAAGAGGVSGSGTLLTAQFRAKSKGPASLGFTGVNFTDAAGKRLDAVPYNTIVEVQ